MFLINRNNRWHYYSYPHHHHQFQNRINGINPIYLSLSGYPKQRVSEKPSRASKKFTVLISFRFKSIHTWKLPFHENKTHKHTELGSTRSVIYNSRNSSGTLRRHPQHLMNLINKGVRCPPCLRPHPRHSKWWIKNHTLLPASKGFPFQTGHLAGSNPPLGREPRDAASVNA